MSPETILQRKWITHVLIWSLPLLWMASPYCLSHMANSVLSHDFTAAPVSVPVISICKIQQTEARRFSFVPYVLHLWWSWEWASYWILWISSSVPVFYWRHNGGLTVKCVLQYVMKPKTTSQSENCHSIANIMPCRPEPSNSLSLLVVWVENGNSSWMSFASKTDIHINWIIEAATIELSGISRFKILYPKDFSAGINTRVTTLPSSMIFLNIILFWKIFFLLCGEYIHISRQDTAWVREDLLRFTSGKKYWI